MFIQDVGGLEPAENYLDLELVVGAVVVGVEVEVAVLADLVGWPATGDGTEEACRKMTMRPSECAEKIASTTTSSSPTAAMR